MLDSGGCGNPHTHCYDDGDSALWDSTCSANRSQAKLPNSDAICQIVNSWEKKVFKKITFFLFVGNQINHHHLAN